MKKQWEFRTVHLRRNCIRIVLAVFLVIGISLLNFDANATGNYDNCSNTSAYAQNACNKAANEVYQLALGKCENELDSNQDGCESDAKTELGTALQVCKDQFAARQVICKAVGEEPYLPNGITPYTFVGESGFNSTGYLPIKDAATLTYKSFDTSNNNEITETDVVKVTKDTRTILGVTCRVVQDKVYEGDIAGVREPALSKLKREDTTDWFAQQDNGNVWYFGEIAQQFAQDTNSPSAAILVGIDGSWTAGVDGAKPGITMYANPDQHIGKTYRLEFALGEAEDDAQVFERTFAFGSVDNFIEKVHSFYPTYDLSALKKLKTSHAPITSTTKILHTHDFSAQDPTSVLEGVYEDKFYAQGVGVILIIANDGSGIVEVLVDYTKP